MIRLTCPSTLVEETLKSLRDAGRGGTEGVVLWLARRPLAAETAIVETFVPEYRAEIDVFHIPPSGMSATMAYLRAGKLVLAAQVHSHPAEAFHSKADDAWAIVRHEHALSVVVPFFASGVSAANFLERSVTFRLSADDRWLRVGGEELGARLEILP